MHEHPVGPETKPLNSSERIGEALPFAVAVMAEKAAKRAAGVCGHASHCNSIGFPHNLGRLRPDTTFASDDHRSYNRSGESFDRGETFSGVDYDVALHVVDRLREIFPAHATLAQWSLRWILMSQAVTCAISGARRTQQIEENVIAAELPELDAPVMAVITSIYAEKVRPLVHTRW